MRTFLAKQGLRLAALGALTLGTAMPSWAYTVTLDFSGAICGDAVLSSCVNGDAISQFYGDIAGVLDVSYRAGANATGATVESSLSYWATGFSNSTDVAYADVANAFGQITFTPLNGTKIWIKGVEVGSNMPDALTYLNIASQPYSDTPDYWFTKYSTAYFRPVDFSDFDIVVSGDTRPLALTWGHALNTGVDRITLEVMPVPEPSPTAMALGAMGLMGALGLRRGRRERPCS